MKQINNYISEKLIINKDIKSIKYNPKEILNWLSINEGSCDRWEILYTHVEDWLKNKIKTDELELCADPETLNDCKLSKEIKKLVNDSLYVNEWCQQELNKSNKLYFNEFEDIEIWFNDHIICNITQYGTLYVINKTYFLNNAKS